MANPKLIFGFIAYGVGSLFLLVSILAAGYRWKTGFYSSGVNIVPTVAALLGSLNGVPWKAFFVFAVLDIVSFFIGSGAKHLSIEQRNPNDA
ncbi:MAG: hypothetical protein NDJ72_00450 [Elusimicrobia bacterium]|nr:hypothetical protein [Elusimicrobiota bacterium]